jgi:hypothetical protein
MFKTPIIAFLAILSTACSLIPKQDDGESDYLAGLEQERLAITLEMREDLLALVTSIEYSNRVLAEVKNGESAISMTQAEMAQLEWNASEVPEGMGIPMSLNTTGHPEPILKMIAQMTGYRYIPIGKPGPAVAPVQLNGHSTAHQHLHSLSTQLGNSVLVDVIPNIRTISVNWNYARVSR